MITLFLFATQGPADLILSKGRLDQSTFARLSSKRAIAAGRRLHEFKARGGSTSTGFDWSKGCYEFTFNASELATHVTHISGVRATMPPQCVVTRDDVVVSNWSDWDAFVQREGLPSMKICTLFHDEFYEQKLGPWAYPAIRGGHSRTFDEMYDKEFELGSMPEEACASEWTSRTVLATNLSSTPTTAVRESREVGLSHLRAIKRRRTD